VKEKNENQPHAKGKVPAFLNAARCGARSRRTGNPCKAPAMKNGRCRMHGGKSSGAPKGNRNALKQGLYTAEMITCRRLVKKLIGKSLSVNKRITSLIMSYFYIVFFLKLYY
jgi:hypothetical protein